MSEYDDCVVPAGKWIDLCGKYQAAQREIERLTAEREDYVVRANANVCELLTEIERLRWRLLQSGNVTPEESVKWKGVYEQSMNCARCGKPYEACPACITDGQDTQ